MDRHAARLEADRWLATLADFGRRAPVGARAFSLDGITRLLPALGDPHLGRRVIHVTGTKGKGTVVHACDAILAAHGVLYDAHDVPHLRNTVRTRRDRRAPDRGGCVVRTRARDPRRRRLRR
jgi:folylpolyglutamate synthase/dihydropteroate synthase